MNEPVPSSPSSPLRRAFKAARTGYYALGFAGLLATAAYMIPPDTFGSALTPGQQRALNSYTIITSDWLLAAEATSGGGPAEQGGAATKAPRLLPRSQL